MLKIIALLFQHTLYQTIITEMFAFMMGILLVEGTQYIFMSVDPATLAGYTAFLNFKANMANGDYQMQMVETLVAVFPFLFSAFLLHNLLYFQPPDDHGEQNAQ